MDEADGTKRPEADFVGGVALVLIAFALLAVLIVFYAAMTAGG